MPSPSFRKLVILYAAKQCANPRVMSSANVMTKALQLRIRRLLAPCYKVHEVWVRSVRRCSVAVTEKMKGRVRWVHKRTSRPSLAQRQLPGVKQTLLGVDFRRLAASVRCHQERPNKGTEIAQIRRQLSAQKRTESRSCFYRFLIQLFAFATSISKML